MFALPQGVHRDVADDAMQLPAKLSTALHVQLDELKNRPKREVGRAVNGALQMFYTWQTLKGRD